MTLQAECPFCETTIEFEPASTDHRMEPPDQACKHWERTNAVGFFVSVWFKKGDKPQVALAEPTDLPGQADDRHGLGRS